MRPTFEHTVDVLVKAFLKDELAHMFCSACAVGNIVAAAIGTRPGPPQANTCEFDNERFEDGSPAHGGWYSSLYGQGSYLGDQQIVATGYNKYELTAIEKAFESCEGRPHGSGIWYGRQTNPVWMFNGLMAVVDVLAEIHGVDLSVKVSAKLKFVKP